MEKRIGLFFGSDTGITEELTHDIIDAFDNIVVKEVSEAKPSDFEDYETIILGLSTWYDGDLQSDWETFFDDFKTIDFTGKKVAIYGLGDQIGYAEYFIDGVGILAEVIIENGGEVIGKWPIEGYRHTESKAIIPNDEDYFYGLALDNDNESELNDERITSWLQMVKEAI
ncbi:flavodoxin FldA [Wenyingzhuangia fucanilytica]|uniref:Flavodoxin n=1 Tax=Wenyingzhuangia fucanilytica TaxID=1790137 RepID=A0A1B1Y6C7_9FLAO|nr:flavodoxin [Wenyingzhuangia fucanilytica]ANW96332.1 flavodoxin FldA [Wenyingzhuangia fucanilytica]